MSRTTNLKAIRIIHAATGLLASCGLAVSAQGAEEQTVVTRDASVGVYRGNPPLYGDSPEWKGDAANFKPAYYAVVYLKFQSNASLTAKHAYFEVKPNTDDAVDCAIEYLISENEENATGCEPYGTPEGHLGPPPWPPAKAGPIVRNLDGFAFGSQHRLYIFVDNANVQFDVKTPVSFTPYGAEDDVDKKWDVTRHENESFYDAEVLTLNSGRRVLTMNNFYKGYHGGMISDKYPYTNSAKYSINFNLRMCREGFGSCDFTDPKQVIALAIDPDTGNGWGSRP